MTCGFALGRAKKLRSGSVHGAALIEADPLLHRILGAWADSNHVAGHVE